MEGRVLAGRYRLLSQLGRGGMGSVWRAEHIDLGTHIAIKLIEESFAQSPEALTRFRREAQAAASLRSANVVQILDYGVDGDTPFIAMEVLEGESLANRLERLGRIDPPQCAAILLQVSKALAKAHDMGIVHRDLKPDNIFLVRDGDDEIAKVLDFGIAKRTGVLQTESDMATRTGSLMGTPYYMSPEQASGRRQVDQRTDIWAFAVIAYECMTGRRPFDDTNLGGLLLNICTEEPPPASSVIALPPSFDAWFSRATAKDPARRFESIREASNELYRAIGQVLPPARVFASSQPDGSLPQPPHVVESVTGPWGQSRPGPAYAATPGAVIMTAAGNSAPTLDRTGKKRRSWLLVGTAAVGALGLASVAAALVWRAAVGDGGSAHLAAVPTASAAPTQALAAASVAAAAEAAAALPHPSAAAPAVPSASAAVAMPAASEPAPSPTPAPERAPTAVPVSNAARSSVTRPKARPADTRSPDNPTEPASPPRIRPQERVERDLGF